MIINGYFKKKPKSGRYFGINEYSYFRDGMMSISYSTNVRDIGADVQRQQSNVSKQLRQKGEQLEPDIKFPYTVYNSDPKFDINTQITIEEILLQLYNEDLQNILRGLKQPVNTKDSKFILIQQIKRLLGRQDRNNYSY